VLVYAFLCQHACEGCGGPNVSRSTTLPGFRTFLVADSLPDAESMSPALELYRCLPPAGWSPCQPLRFGGARHQQDHSSRT